MDEILIVYIANTNLEWEENYIWKEENEASLQEIKKEIQIFFIESI